MSEIFTDIKFEVYISGAWVDLSPDVKATPAPTGSRGISGNGIEDRVGDVGRLKFSLDNSAGNSAGLIGRYSPDHTNCLSGWTVSLPVRLTFAYDTWSVIKWYGRIETDGITVIPGTLTERRVDVSCIDYMGLAAEHKINLLTLQANIQLWEAVDLVLANMPIQPLATEYADQTIVFDDMPVVFDIAGTETTALGEFQKLASSQRMYIFCKGGGDGEILASGVIYPDPKQIPVVTAAADNLLLETGDDILLETGDFLLLDMFETATFSDSDFLPGTNIGYGKNLYNFVTIITYPRRLDAAATTVLWTLETATALIADEIITFRGAYHDPTGEAVRFNATDFVTPVSGTDYKANASADGTGADMTSDLSMFVTFGAAEVEFYLHNNHVTNTMYIGGDTAGAFLQARGRGIRTMDTARVISQDATSIALHGVRPINIDFKYQDAPTGKQGFGAALVTAHKDPRYSGDNIRFIANKNSQSMSGFLFTEVRDVLTLSDTMTGYSFANDGVVQGYEFEIINKNAVYWTVTTKNGYS